MTSQSPVKKVFPLLLLSALIALLCVAQQKQDDPIKAADIAFCQATREKGLDGWMSYFADNAVLNQAEPPIQGKPALRQHYKTLFSRRNLDFRWSPVKTEVFPSGEMGYSSGRYSMTFIDDKGAKVSSTGNYLTVWHRQPDSTWKVIADFGSPDKPTVK